MDAFVFPHGVASGAARPALVGAWVPPVSVCASSPSLGSWRWRLRRGTVTRASAGAVKKAIPNVLTVGRVLAVPALPVVFMSHAAAPVLPVLLFAVASLTDLVDGYLARKWDATTRFGQFLDPVADKLLVAAALMLILPTAPAILLPPAIAIVSREILVSALREWMALAGDSGAVAVGLAGKVKTTVQMISIAALLAITKGCVPTKYYAQAWAGSVGLLYVAAALTVYSAALYFKAAWTKLT